MDINNDPMYWLGAAFFLGILFSTWSWGIAYFFLFIIFWEIGVCWFYKYNGYHWDVSMRFGLAAGSLLGFLIGRCITETDDHLECMEEFHQYCRSWLECLDIIDEKDKEESVSSTLESSTIYIDSDSDSFHKFRRFI